MMKTPQIKYVIWDWNGTLINDSWLFVELMNDLDEISPDASFIPEIWQGHKNAGEGFWIALDRLENYF